jgi:hypothetical protein
VNFGGLPEAPGDGFSMYPGPTISQPMSSIRLEAMRDGEEDYEYFVMLDKLIAEGEKKGRSDPTIYDAREARDAAKALVKDLTQYEKRGAPYLELRERIGDSIEKLMRK